ncbi:MAG: glycosyltransferase family 4 protein [Planctomycetota bacterium]
MGKEKAKDKTEIKAVRPALIVSPRNLYDYSILLKHLLAGFTDESVPAALVCNPDNNTDHIITPTTEIIGHPVIHLPLMGHFNRKMLTEKLANFEPTVLHCLCQTKAALTRKIARQLDIPYVLSINSIHKKSRHLHVSNQRCASLIAPANTIAAGLMTSHPRLSDRVTLVEMGAFVSQSISCFHRQSELVSMVTTHSFDSKDDFENLLNAIKHLVIDGYELMLIIMGGGKAEKEMRKFIAELGLRWVVTIVPRLEQWRSVLAAGDIFIRPRPSKTFDPFLLEVMAVGNVVAACKGGVDDLLVDQKTCVTFDPDDELSIYSSLQKLLDRREFALKLAQDAQQRLHENNSPSKMVADTLQIYRDAENWYQQQQ